MSIAPVPPSVPRPDASELWSLAETLGIELPQEKHLLHIVRSAMKADLPPNWSSHQTVLPDGSSVPFYFNSKSGQSRWMRPITAANHEALRVARASGSVSVPVSVAATPSTTPPHSVSQTPRGGPGAAGSSHTTSASVASSSSSSSAIATAASTAARFLLSPPSAASSGSATPNAATPGRKSKTSSIDIAAGGIGFSLEIQKDILASFDGASLKSVQMVQRCFRRWRQRKQELIRAKIKVHRATMDKEMMTKLAMGTSASKEKRRTTMEAGASAFLAQAAAAVNSGNSSANNKGGLALPASARTTPSTPARTPTGRQSPVTAGASSSSSGGNSLVVPGSASSSSSSSSGGTLTAEEEAAKAAKKRASMLRMLNIQNRFRADGTVEVVAVPDGATPAATPQKPKESAAAPASSASSSSASTTTPQKVGFSDDVATEDGGGSSDRRGPRLNNRRRTFTQDDADIKSSSASIAAASEAATAAQKAGSPRNTRPSPSSAAAAAAAAASNEALKSWRFIRLVIRVQKRFKAHRIAMRAKLAAKIEAQHRRQTQDTDRKLRRASLPFSDLSAIRKRLSNQPMPVADALASKPAQAK